MHEATKTHFQTLSTRRKTYHGKRRMRRRTATPPPALELHPATRDYLRQVGRRGGKKVAHLMRNVDPLHFVRIGAKGGSVKSPAKKTAARLRYAMMMQELERAANMALVVEELAGVVPQMTSSLWDKLTDELRESLRRYRL